MCGDLKLGFSSSLIEKNKILGKGAFIAFKPFRKIRFLDSFIL